ncbi:hypothetical protein CCS77_0834 [Campylobacter concisus]|uniref:Uncharacterized protein n=1 Tax=Campylobacter concisus TaxID=199 RepID=A0A2R4NZN2_9BACT|nr:hypothetical protein CCS77_0834 [Campylobacter concisus]
MPEFLAACGTIVLSHALLTCEGFGGFKKVDKRTALLRKLATASRP